jgi:formylglycine-generating enzyme required for sulfatase activity
MAGAGNAQQPPAMPEAGRIKMAPVQGGTFQMGSPVRATGYNVDMDESPQITVTVGNFEIGVTPVTQAQWRTMMGSNLSDFEGDNLPVETVTWYEAVAFCNRLSKREGLAPVYRDYGPYGTQTMRLIFADPAADGYRLPTEAEWEYAARGGMKSKSTLFPGGSDPDSVGWHRGNSGNQTHPVGQKTPNELGLYDMAGNVLQWCWAAYDVNAYRNPQPTDPSLSYKNWRVARGAAFWNRPESLRVTKRNGFPAQNAFNFVGFRVARGANPDIGIKRDADWQQRMLKNFSTEIPPRPNLPEKVADKVAPPPSPKNALQNVPEVEVKSFNGAPTLFINGKPNTGLMLWRHAAKGAAEFADFRESGIHLIQPDLPLIWVWKADGTLDLARIDGVMKEIIGANPDALVMPRVHMHQPGWWRMVHPERMVAGYAPGPDKWAMGDWDINTYADPLWREQAANAAQALIRYLEEYYGDHIMGYLIGAGDTGEWSPGWVNSGEFDFNPIQRDAFRKWLGDPKAEVPRDRLRDKGTEFFNDPARDATQIKYVQFESEATTDTLLFFAGKFRETLNALGRKRVLGAFFGYRWAMYYRMGTHDFQRVLKSPDINLISSLSQYSWRVPGGIYFSTANAASIALHGKLLYNEEDSATPLSKRVKAGWDGSRYGPPNMQTARELLIHKVLAPWIEGGTTWYMDWLNEDWYRAPELLQTISDTQKLLSSQLGKERGSVAQIAVFSDEKSVARIRPRSENLDNWRSWIREPMARLGAPADFFDVGDLDAVAKTGRYKLFVFLDSPAVDPARIPAGVSTLWTYLPGYSAEAASKTIGFPVATARASSVWNPGAQPAQNSGATQVAPGLWRKGRTFWAPAPPLTLESLRGVAEAAGVHFYAKSGSQISTNGNLLMIHAASDGEQEIQLPRKSKVVDAFSGQVVADNADSFHVTFKKGETGVWKLN